MIAPLFRFLLRNMQRKVATRLPPFECKLSQSISAGNSRSGGQKCEDEPFPMTALRPRRTIKILHPDSSLKTNKSLGGFRRKLYAEA
jgi:hypothetical protein